MGQEEKSVPHKQVGAAPAFTTSQASGVVIAVLTNGKMVAKTQLRGLNTTKTQGPETLAFPSFSVTRWVPVFRVRKHGTAHLPEEFSRMNS